MFRLAQLLLLGCCVFAAQTISTAQQSPDDSENKAALQAIQSTLDAQVAAWNAGDIPGFMAGYVNSAYLRFASGNTVTSGWDSTLQRYQSRYAGRNAMGTLAFRDITITPLCAEYAEVFGRFHLSRDSDVGDATGLFTLLMKNTNGRWLVWHDHTSSASN